MIVALSRAIARTVTEISKPSVTLRRAESFRLGLSMAVLPPTHSRLPTGLARAASLSEDMTLEAVFFTLFNGAMGKSKTLAHSGVAIAKRSPLPNGQVR